MITAEVQSNHKRRNSTKKSVALLLCLLRMFSCVILPACGSSRTKDLSGSKYVGTWKAVSLTLRDEVGERESETFLILNADGTAEFTSDDEVSKCTWKKPAADSSSKAMPR